MFVKFKDEWNVVTLLREFNEATTVTDAISNSPADSEWLEIDVEGAARPAEVEILGEKLFFQFDLEELVLPAESSNLDLKLRQDRLGAEIGRRAVDFSMALGSKEVPFQWAGPDCTEGLHPVEVFYYMDSGCAYMYIIRKVDPAEFDRIILAALVDCAKELAGIVHSIVGAISAKRR